MSPSRRQSTAARALSWIFREAPPDGGKDFGNAAVYATPQSIKTVVREDGQNSLDAARTARLTLRFRLIELSVGTEKYERFLEAMRFDDLVRHIDAIEEAEYESKLGTKLIAARDHLREESLILLCVEDFGGHGLTGDDFDSKGSFCALVRDNLNSQKAAAQTAGGVFGLGAKVNIACSRLSTVLFASKVAGSQRKGIRVVGRAETTYHEVKDRRTLTRYAGPAWLGRENSSGVAESIWFDDDDPALENLFLSRSDPPQGVRASDGTGTSLLIVGFTDPQTESGASIEQLAEYFAEAAAVNFWPAMLKGQLVVWVDCLRDDLDSPVRTIKVDPSTVPGVRELCEAWKTWSQGSLSPSLRKEGDVVGIEVPMTIPATRPRVRGVKPNAQVQASSLLLVRLANGEGSGGDPRNGHIAYIRGRGMITRYQSRQAASGGRSFHATLLGGTLLGYTPEQLAAEQFLRLAEPPAHDKWEYNQDLREKYLRGAKRALDEALDRVTEELQRALRPSNIGAREGPEALKRLLQFGRITKETSKQPSLKILRSTAHLVDGAWSIEADLSLGGGPRPVLVSPRLVFQTEGADGIPVGWRVLSSDDTDARLVDGGLLLPGRTKRVTIRAVSDPTTHPVDARFAAAAVEVSARYQVEE